MDTDDDYGQTRSTVASLVRCGRIDEARGRLRQELTSARCGGGDSAIEKAAGAMAALREGNVRW